MAELDKRITGVLMNKEKMPEYNDALVKRTFAAFLNELKNPTFRRSMEKDRKVEDLLLIFFSKATSELQKGKAPEDDSWKLMVDRHVALLVRIIGSTLQNNDWSRDRPEVSARLKTLEQKLLQHDQDLTTSTKSIEVEIPRSYEVKDMPLVLLVSRVFGSTAAQAQSDINSNRDNWTERAALRDLKDYQNHMMLGTHVTLTSDDFDLDDAYEIWKKGEISDIGQMILAIVKSNPELSKSGNNTAANILSSNTSALSTGSSGHTETPQAPSDHTNEIEPSYVLDVPVDMSGLDLDGSTPSDTPTEAVDANFTFIPSNTRQCYKQVLKNALTYDMHNDRLVAPEPMGDPEAVKLLSKATLSLLDEIAMRWRVPRSTRMVLFLDVIRDKYQQQEITSETIDHAFLWFKQPPSPPKKGPGKRQSDMIPLFDRSMWTLQDFALNQTILGALHDALLRELFELFQLCYESKPPSIGSVMYVLENHIYDDELFSKEPEDLDAFSASLANALKQKAQAKYHELLSKTVSDDASEWQLYSVIQLGQGVTSLCAKIQKRYRKNPEVMNVNPLSILIEEILPSFGEDARALVTRILELADQRDEKVPIEDGFALYKELVEIRRIQAQALPGKAFGFHIEDLLQDFVWRWIEITDSKIVEWIAEAAKRDTFQVRQNEKDQEQGIPPTFDERHSESAVDVYRIFNQSIEQIVNLEWDDDLQYAKFMTAISKSVDRGVARYCEVLEGLFTKEMDRQTPEQEMRAQQTQKERWLAYAKDVYQTSGKGAEKIEPFQFWPESFVKINNIEFATLQLDKLEKEVNADACAEVINRLAPPPPPSMRRSGQTKYMFTIKIIEAEDLKAGDINGLSDPYVVLGDEYSKRLAKTRTVYQSLSPRWDETVDILTSGALNIIATVWDWDMMGDHDCLGRTSLKLDPTHFNDFVPREYWLDLDTQGRVLVRVSMEGERDDIQFHFGKAFRTLRRAEKEMTRKVTDKLSTYIHQCLSRRTLRSLLGQGTIGGVSISGMKGYFSKAMSGRPNSVVASPGPAPMATQQDVTDSLKPLLKYFDDNFAIMKLTLTDSAMISVMTRLWKEVLITLEGLLVPPLSDKPSSQRQLNQQEMDIVYRWLQVSVPCCGNMVGYAR